MSGKTDAAPLEGVVVLDLTRYIAGPYCTMMLADAGADVIKVEPRGGEVTRTLRPLLVDADGEQVSGYFLRLNRRKRSICLDLRTAEDREVFLTLVEKADVVVENFRPGVMDRLGIGSAVLVDRNPRVVVCSISGFGQSLDSPYRDWPAFHLIPEAMAGVLSQTGTDARPPRSLGPVVGDLVPAMNAFSAILLALLRRGVSGRGSVVDIAMYDSMIALGEMAFAMESMTGTPTVYGDRDPNTSPYGFFPANDGYVGILVGPFAHWQKLCELMGAPELADDPRLDTGPHRAALFEELIEPPLLAWLSTMGKEEAGRRLALAGIPGGPVRTAFEAATDEAALAHGMITEVASPGGGSWTIVGNPIRMSPAVELGDAVTVAPGAHSIDVLTALGGYSEDAAREIASR